MKTQKKLKEIYSKKAMIMNKLTKNFMEVILLMIYRVPGAIYCD